MAFVTGNANKHQGTGKTLVTHFELVIYLSIILSTSHCSTKNAADAQIRLY